MSKKTDQPAELKDGERFTEDGVLVAPTQNTSNATPIDQDTSILGTPSSSNQTADADASAAFDVSGQSVTAEQLAQMQAKAAKADEYWDRLVRQVADFDNFKKRVARERQEAAKYANEGLLNKLIPILDTFDMAITAANQTQSTSLESLKTGINMIYSQLKNVLTEAGLEEIDATQKPFDPNLHEAVSQQESKEVPEGQVLQQLRKGYKLRDRLIRPAMVVVAKQPNA